MRKYYVLAFALLLIAALTSSCFAAIVGQDIKRGVFGNAYDAGLRSDGAPDGNLGDASHSGMGRLYPDVGYPADKGPRHFIVKFDTSVISSSTVLTGAVLGVWMGSSGVTSITDYKISRVLTTWNEGTGGYPTANPGGVTWNSRIHGTALWQTPGATGATDIDLASSLTWAQSVGYGGYKTFSSADYPALLTWAQGWINGTLTNQGVLFWGGVGSGSGSYYYLLASEEVDPNMRPYLRVEWDDGLPERPTMTAPIGGVWVATLTPTLTWTSNSTGIIAHQARVCGTDDPEASVIWDSGTVAGSGASEVSGALDNNSDYWAFAREQNALGWGDWSIVGNGGFHVSVSPPATPVITAPTGVQTNPKPYVIFTGDAHTMVRMKVFTSNVGDPETAPAYSDSGDLTSNGFSCPTGLLANGDYWAFVKIANAAGWSSWSAAQPFSVARADVTDILHMSETNILGTDAPAPNDGLGYAFTDFDNSNTWTITQTAPICANQTVAIHDEGDGRGMRRHRVMNIDLDLGVTILWAMKANVTTWDGDEGGATWRCANIWVADNVGGPTGNNYMAAFRLAHDRVSIVYDNVKATWGGGAGWDHAGLPISTDFRVIRVTGRNAVAGDYSSTVWQVWINEDIQYLTRSGTFDINTVEGNPTYLAEYKSVGDHLGVGQGGRRLHGDWAYDWLAVNCSGDYGPGEWNPFSGGGVSANIGAAKAAGSEAAPCNILYSTGGGVITKVVTHEEIQGDPPVPVTIQDGFYCQDIAGPANIGSGIYVATSDTKSGAVVPGAKITALAGVMSEHSLVTAEQTFARPGIGGASFTLEGSSSYPATALAQKTLASACIDQNLGSNLDTMCMLVRTFGKVTLASFTGGGNPYFNFDDGSGAVDGREEAAGIRVVLPIDAEYIPTVGDYIMVEGIAVYEAVTGGPYANVRTLLYPTVTQLATGLP